METIYYTGYHGSGKTYLANSLCAEFNASVLDTGPIIRSNFGKSGEKNMSTWIEKMRLSHGKHFTDDLIYKEVARIIDDDIPKNKNLFIVGNRDISGIKYLSDRLLKVPNILLINSSICSMKSGIEARTNKLISDLEFNELVKADEECGLSELIDYVNDNPNHCYIVDNLDHDYVGLSNARHALTRIIKNK